MGIKENFTQAVKELTGMGNDSSTGSTEVRGTPEPVEELKRAVDDGASSQPREITLEPKQPLPVVQDTSSDWEGYDMATNVRPMAKPEPAAQTEQDLFDLAKPDPTVVGPVQPAQTEPTPAASQFMQGGETPVSLFGGQGQAPSQSTPFAREAATQSTQPVQPIQLVQPASTPPPPAPPMGPSPAFSNRSYGRNEDNELTIISRNTYVDGNVRSFADMSIDGDIKGDVETTKNVDLNGKIIGNIICNNAMMHTSQIQGNVRMKGNVSMKRDTLLMGDLMSTYADINGKVKGNLDVVGKADLKGDAVVFGDISASTITVEDGAIIQGYVSTTFLNKEESKNLFPDTVIINEVGSAGA